MRDFSPGRPSVLAAGQLDHLRDPVAAHVDRVEPFERCDARARRPLHGLLHGREARARLHKPRAGLGHAGGVRQARHVGKHLASVDGSSEITPAGRGAASASAVTSS